MGAGLTPLRLGVGEPGVRKERRKGACCQRKKRRQFNLFFFFFLTVFFSICFLSLPMLKVEVEQKGKRTVTNANP